MNILYAFAARPANLDNNFAGLMPGKQEAFLCSSSLDFQSTYREALDYRSRKMLDQQEIYIYVLRTKETLQPDMNDNGFLMELYLKQPYQVIGIIKLPAQDQYTDRVPYLFINTSVDDQSRQNLNRLANAVYNGSAELKLRTTSIPVFAIDANGKIQKNENREIAKNFVDVYNQVILLESETEVNTVLNNLANSLLQQLREIANDINKNAENEQLFLKSYIDSYNQLRKTVISLIGSALEKTQDSKLLNFMEMLDRLHVTTFGHLGYESNWPFEAEFNIAKQVDQFCNKFEELRIAENDPIEQPVGFWNSRLTNQLTLSLEGKSSHLVVLDKTDFMKLKLQKKSAQLGFIDLPSNPSQNPSAIYILADNLMLTQLKDFIKVIVAELKPKKLLPDKLIIIQHMTRIFFERLGDNTAQANHVKLNSDIGLLHLTPVNAIGNSKDQNRHQALLMMVLLRNLIEENLLPSGKINYFKDSNDRAFVFYQLHDNQGKYLLDTSAVENRIFDLNDRKQFEKANEIYNTQEQDVIKKLFALLSLPFSNCNSNIRREKFQPLELKSKTIVLFGNETAINSFCIMSSEETAGFVRSPHQYIKKDNYSVLKEWVDSINSTHELSIQPESQKIKIIYPDSDALSEYYNPFSMQQMAASTVYNLMFDPESSFPPFPMYVVENPETHVVVIVTKVSCMLDAVTSFCGKPASSPHVKKFKDTFFKMRYADYTHSLKNTAPSSHAGWCFSLAVMPNFDLEGEELAMATAITRGTLQVLSNQIKQLAKKQGINFYDSPSQVNTHDLSSYDANGKYKRVSPESISLTAKHAFTVRQMNAFLRELKVRGLFSQVQSDHLQKTYQEWYMEGKQSSNRGDYYVNWQRFFGPTQPTDYSIFAFKSAAPRP